MDLLQLQQPETDIIAISISYTHRPQTEETLRSIPVAAKTFIQSPEYIRSIPPKPTTFMWVSLSQEER